jgi:hypothetical protein
MTAQRLRLILIITCAARVCLLSGLAGFYPNPFGRAAFIVGLAFDVSGATVVVATISVLVRPRDIPVDPASMTVPVRS